MALALDSADSCILITGPLTEGSGNYSTAQRILHYFEQRGNQCFARNVSDFESPSDFQEFITSERIDCILALHAFKCRTVLKDCPVPFAVIFGGTDLNENTKDETDREIVIKVALSARFLVVFSNIMYEKVVSLMPHFDHQQIWTIPQAVKTYPAPRYDWRKEHRIEDDAVVFTLVAGLRPVKDPLFLVRCFSDWWKNNSHQKTVFLIVGPKHDKGFSDIFLETLRRSSGVQYLGPLSISQTHRVIADSFALVNSSTSEGMSTAILEAMELGVPVIARNIPGNASIVEHKKTGLLYNEPKEFLEMAELLMNDHDLRTSLIENGRKQIKDRHSSEMEKCRYFELVRKLCSDELSEDHHRSVERSLTQSKDGKEDGHFDSINGCLL